MNSGKLQRLHLRGSPPVAPCRLAMLLRLLAPRLLDIMPIMLPHRLAILLWLRRLLLLRRRLLWQLHFISPRVPIGPKRLRHGQQPVHAKPSRCPLRLEPVAIEEAMTTDVSKRRYQMVLL